MSSDFNLSAHVDLEINSNNEPIQPHDINDNPIYTPDQPHFPFSQDTKHISQMNKTKNKKPEIHVLDSTSEISDPSNLTTQQLNWETRIEIMQ